MKHAGKLRRAKRHRMLLCQGGLLATTLWAIQTAAIFATPATTSPDTPSLASMFYTSSPSSVVLVGPAPNLELGRFQHTSTLLRDGRVLVAGGVVASKVRTSTAEIFDPAANSWQFAANMLQARSGHTATLLPDGRVLVAGGVSNGGGASSSATELATTEYYDPVSNSWSEGPHLASPRALQSATLLNDGRVLVLGGPLNGPGSATSDVISPSGNQVATLPSPPYGAVAGESATLLRDGSVLVAGGSSGRAPGYLAGAAVFHPPTNEWTSIASMLLPHSQQSATAMSDGRVLIVGGEGAGEDGEIFDPNSGAWRTVPSSAQRRVLHTAELLPSGKIVVTGGINEQGFGAETAVFDPSASAWSALDQSATLNAADPSLVKLLDGRLLATGGAVETQPAPPPSPGPTATTARAGTDDYPSGIGVYVSGCSGIGTCPNSSVWNLRNSPEDTLIDAWGFYNRECTSFAAWRMQRDGHPMTNSMIGPNGQGGQFGNASNWYSHAVAIGIPTSSTASIGWVAQTAYGNHVGYVEATGGAYPYTENYNNCCPPNGLYFEMNWTYGDAKFLNFGPPPGPGWAKVGVGATATEDRYGREDISWHASGGQTYIMQNNIASGPGTWGSSWMLVNNQTAFVESGKAAIVWWHTDLYFDVAIRGTNGHIWTTHATANPNNYYAPSSWTTWTDQGAGVVGADFVSSPAFSRDTNDYIWMWAVDSLGNLSYKTNTGSGWSAWANAPLTQHVATSDVSARQWSYGGVSQTDIVARGTDGALWHCLLSNRQGGTWYDWAALGSGSVISSPTAMNSMRTDPNLRIIATGADGNVWTTFNSGSGWGAWQLYGSSPYAALGGATSEPGGVAYDWGYQMDLFEKGSAWLDKDSYVFPPGNYTGFQDWAGTP